MGVEILLSMLGVLTSFGWNLFTGGYFGNVGVVGLSPSDIEEEVSMSGESDEGEDDEDSDVVEKEIERMEEECNKEGYL